MAESRIFKVPEAFDLKSLATSMTAWLKDNKNVAARNFPTKEGYVVQSSAIEPISHQSLRRGLGLDRKVSFPAEFCGAKL